MGPLTIDRVWSMSKRQSRTSLRSHPFHVVKNLFRHRKVRNRGLAKNQGQLFALFGLANLVIVKRPLLDARGEGAS